MSGYDHSIHSNPDAQAWARMFSEMYPAGCPCPDEDTMRGWFANAMMAAHDHLKKPSTTSLSVEERIKTMEKLLVEVEAALYWAADKSPEAAKAMVMESFGWRARARQVLRTPAVNPDQEKPMQKPTVGRIVHYHSYGTPKGEFKPLPRAAIVTQVNEDGTIGLCAVNPTGLFFHECCPYAEEPTPGHWNWPPYTSATMVAPSEKP